jgi:hypothetical protein
MQALVRSMPDLHKTLILANVRENDEGFSVDEMALATEHAPFRHKNAVKGVGSQTKETRTGNVDESDGKRSAKDMEEGENDEGDIKPMTRTSD